MKKLIPLLIGLLLCFNLAHAQHYEWLQQRSRFAGTGQGGNYQALTKTRTGIVVLSCFSDSLSLGNLHFQAPGRVDLYLAKYDLAGTLIWAKQIKNNQSYGGPVTATTDSLGNIFISAYFNDSLRIGNNVTTHISQYNPTFIAKFNDSGALQWVNVQHSTQSVWLNSLATDRSGNVYATGMFHPNITLGNITYTGGAGSSLYLVKYNAAGQVKWVRLGNGPQGGGQGRSIAVSRTGDIFLAGGAFAGTVLGSVTLNKTGTFLAKFDSTATVKWAQLYPRSQGAYVSLDKQDNLCLYGTYIDTMRFNNQVNLVKSGGGLFIAKANPAGTWLWAKGAEVTTSGYFSGLATDTADNIYATGRFTGQLQTGNLNVTNANTPNTFVLKLTAAGNAQYLHKVGSSTHYNASTGIEADNMGSLYLLGDFAGTAYFGNDSLTTIQTYANSYLAKFSMEVNTVSGEVFIDLNHNQIRDTNEPANPEVILTTTPGHHFTNPVPGGQYAFTLPKGNFNVSIPQAPKYYTVNPTSHSVAFNVLGQTAANKHFALQPAPNVTDVSVTVTNVSVARPGGMFRYRVTVKNVGTVTLSDTLAVNFNGNLLLLSQATPAGTPQGNQLKWYYQNLKPNERQHFDIAFTIKPTTPLNALIRTTALVKPLAGDQFPADNTDTLTHTVVTSFDPNDKQVDHATLTPAQVTSGKFLDYTIRFQNTGNDTAFTVIVRDSISDKLQIPSLELLSASHPYTFRILPDGLAEWRFDNILLPDSNRNEPASHGFIRYRMRPKTNLVLGDEIKSRAEIYFDFNAPVMTNYAVTRVAMPLGIKPGATVATTFNLYPNPASNFVTVEANSGKPGIAEISLMNILGQTVATVKLPTNGQLKYRLPVGQLPQGVYLVRLRTGNDLLTKRLEIQ